MMNIFSLLIILTFSSSLLADQSDAFFTPRASSRIDSQTAIRSMMSPLSRDHLIANLRAFVDSSRPGRILGTKGHKNAQEFL